jgi:dolichyl-phosphate beta-glucosyltransferase
VKRSLHTRPDLSVVIPAYNESQRLPPFLERTVSFLDLRTSSYEILVVDDGSRDNTAHVVEVFAASNPNIRLIRSACNMGKGAAVRRGIQAAHGRLQLFADADGATPIEELERLERALETGADLAIGSRALASRSSRYTVQAKWHRSALGVLFNAVVQRLGLDGIEDTQCGFKLFRKTAAQDLFSLAAVDGYGLDLELLYIAKRRGYRIAEVPVNWSDQPGSKVRPLRDGFAMLRALLDVRRRDAYGCYVIQSRPSRSHEPILNQIHRSPLP